MANVGAKIKELRTRRELSVRELGLRSGVSHSTISLIERDRMSPSIDTLAAILDALGATLAGFFVDLQSALPYDPFYAAADLVEIRQDEKLSFKMIGLNHPNRQLLLLHETYAVGADTGDGVAHAGQEAGLVLSGEVEVTVAGRSRVLRQGDAYYFDSRMPHRFRNLSDQTGEILSALTPPSY